MSELLTHNLLTWSGYADFVIFLLWFILYLFTAVGVYLGVVTVLYKVWYAFPVFLNNLPRRQL